MQYNFFRTSKLNEAAVTIVTLTFVLSLVVLITWSLFMWRKQSGNRMCHNAGMRISLTNYLVGIPNSRASF